MQIKNYNSPQNFTALHIANAGNLKLYKLKGSADLRYLKTLPDTIDIGELMPHLPKDQAQRWQEMLEYAVDTAQIPENTTYLETIGNKPCGIITFFMDKTAKLDCICTWGVETGKKVQLAGKTLFYQLFRDFQDFKGRKLELEAITNGPTDTIKKYSELGFKKTSRVYPTKTIMEANEHAVKQAYARLQDLIPYETVEPQKINLARELD